MLKHASFIRIFAIACLCAMIFPAACRALDISEIVDAMPENNTIESLGVTYDVEALTPFPASRLRRIVTLPTGRNIQYYAQNDPIWDGVIYETRNPEMMRPFGDGGCNPTTLAMVVASLVPDEVLPRIADYSRRERGFQICTCSVNTYNCYNKYTSGHVSCVMETGLQYRLLLPLVLGDYACENNTNRLNYRIPPQYGGGTQYSMYKPVCEIYGIQYAVSSHAEDMYATLEAGGLCILLCGGPTQPFSGGNGHYIIAADCDDEYVYLLDPFIRFDYPKDKYSIIERVEPGVLKVLRSNFHLTVAGKFFLFTPGDQTEP